MDAFVLWLLSFWAPDLARLGHAEWRVREAETRRCDNLLAALLLPRDHSDPEVLSRARALRTRHLKRFDLGYWERVLRSRDYREWLRLCVVEGEPRSIPLSEVFRDLHTSHAKARLYMRMTAGSDWVPHWLQGIFIPDEYDLWLAHRAAYRARLAPPPRELSRP